MKITGTKNKRFFAIMTYVIFFVEIGICGLVMLLGLPEKTLTIIETIVSTPMAWSSFFVLMIWAKKLYPDMTRNTHKPLSPQDWPQPPISCRILFIRGSHLKRPWGEGPKCTCLGPGCEL